MVERKISSMSRPPATPEKVNRRVIVKAKTVDLSEEYAGWWVRFGTNPPLGVWMEAMNLISSYDDEDPSTLNNSFKGMVRMLSSLVLDWNIADEEGQYVPITDDGIMKLPLDILGEVFQRVNSEISAVPLVNSSA